MINLQRRGFLGLLAAPAIVRVASIMPVSVMPAELLAGDFSTDMMRYKATEHYAHIAIHQDFALTLNPDAFRRIIEPGLRAAFDGVYDEVLKGESR